jgi:hypothetical protein
MNWRCNSGDQHRLDFLRSAAQTNLFGLEHLVFLPAPSFELTQAHLDLLLHLSVEPGAVAEQLEHHAHLLLMLHLVHGRR